MRSKKTATETTTKMPALITTNQRGVFFGYINPEDVNKEDIEASDVQMCVYWDTPVKGVLGLAAHGPSPKSRVTAVTKRALIKGVTLIVEASAEAVKAWKKHPWG